MGAGDAIMVDPHAAEAVLRVVTFTLFTGLGWIILRSLIWPGRSWW